MKSPLIIVLYILIGTNVLAQQRDKWLQTIDFDTAKFRTPEIAYAPFARWWWPGNDVSKDELVREINVLADNGFGGVEIQPLNIGLPLIPRETGNRILSWDSEEYYANARTVLIEARRRGLTVDFTNGSGWPPGGPFLDSTDGFKSLEYTALTLDGGKNSQVALPKPLNGGMPLLVCVNAYRLSNPSKDSGQLVKLDASSAIGLTNRSVGNTLNITLPIGRWKIIAFWDTFSGERTNIAAMRKQGPVVDHFDSTKVIKLYEHLFGDRTGLKKFYGNPMRAVFNDSYEFKANRHYSRDFLSAFLEKRGYDVSKWLPANMQQGYNYASYLRPHVQPDFFFSNQDWRLRYDYDLTLSELLQKHFFNPSKSWLESRGLLHRTQAYGLNMDMIAMAGSASIPETESMLGNEASLKVATSGSLLYNKPIVSAESVVFINRAYTTTPQVVKTAVDKLFSAGVNQIVYHGIPYRYTSEKMGTQGWYPFSTPFISGINFSTNLGEGNVFWNDQKQLNEYVARSQYALRSGKPISDVLIYFPYLNLEDIPSNPKEIMTRGDMPVNSSQPPNGNHGSLKTQKMLKVYDLINGLEANGISWAWVNDETLQQAQIGIEGDVIVRKNRFQAIILAFDSIIQLKTAQRLRLLSQQGMNFYVIGSIPDRQPSFLDWKKNDALTRESISAALKGKNAKYLKQSNEIGELVDKIKQPLKFRSSFNWLRHAKRELSSGDRIYFLWNTSDKWQRFEAHQIQHGKSYWLNAETGGITNNASEKLQYQLPPFGSILLYISKSKTNSPVQQESLSEIDTSSRVLALERWNITFDSIRKIGSNLFDLKDSLYSRFVSSPIHYSIDFSWSLTDTNATYYLDLGRVNYTAHVILNGDTLSKKIFSPFMVDISRHLRKGINQLIIRVMPGQLNAYIGFANSGDRRYAQFKGMESELMSAGLLGPVFIRRGMTIK